MDTNFGACSDGNGQSHDFSGKSNGLMVILLHLARVTKLTQTIMLKWRTIMVLRMLHR
jgi:hypothetical protein